MDSECRPQTFSFWTWRGSYSNLIVTLNPKVLFIGPESWNISLASFSEIEQINWKVFLDLDLWSHFSPDSERWSGGCVVSFNQIKSNNLPQNKVVIKMLGFLKKKKSINLLVSHQQSMTLRNPVNPSGAALVQRLCSTCVCCSDCRVQDAA